MSTVQITFHRSRVQVIAPLINYQTTQIPLDLIEHFVKRLGLGDSFNVVHLSLSWWPVLWPVKSDLYFRPAVSLSFINDDISLTYITKQIHYLKDKKASIKYSKPFVDKNLPNNVIPDHILRAFAPSHLILSRRLKLLCKRSCDWLFRSSYDKRIISIGCWSLVPCCCGNVSFFGLWSGAKMLYTKEYLDAVVLRGQRNNNNNSWNYWAEKMFSRQSSRPYTVGSFRMKLALFEEFIAEFTYVDEELNPEERQQILQARLTNGKC